MTWNALSGATATGKVASIDPTATTSNNVVTYGVVVDLTTLPKGIRIGQSTNVVVTTASTQNVLAVTSAAVTGAGTNGPSPCTPTARRTASGSASGWTATH